MALGACEATYKRPGRIKCPSYLTVFAKNQHFFSLRVTYALLRGVRTLKAYLMCSFKNFENMMMSSR